MMVTMQNDIDGQSLINAFFQALEQRAIEECKGIIAQLQMLSIQQRVYGVWSRYFEGILANEHEHNWARAEQIFRSLLQNNPEISLSGRILVALGNTYAYQGKWTDAIHACEQSLQIFITLGQPINQAKSKKQIAVACCRGFIAGDFGVEWLYQGETHCHEALALLQEETDNIWLIGSIFSTLGSLNTYLQRWERALDYYQRDLAICEQLNDQHGMGISYLNLGEVYQRRTGPDLPRALDAYHQALAIFRRYQNRYLEADLLTNLGSLYLALGEQPSAIDAYTQAIAVIERLRTNVSAADARANFFATMVQTYASLIQLYIAQPDAAAAFNLVERARARTFIELLAEQSIAPPIAAPPTLIEQEQHLRQHLNELYAAPPADSHHLTQTTEQLDALLQQIRLLASEYTDLRTVQPLTHAEIQQRLPATVALLAYFTSNDALYAFVVTQDRLTVHPLPLKFKELQRAFDEEGYLVRMTLGSDQRLHDPFVLQPLYERLIRPLVEGLQGGVQTLCIVPHGLLHFMPFHALSYKTAGGATRALLDDYQLVYAPSATVLLDYCQQKVSHAAQPLLAVGYNGDLHHAEAEARAIAQLVPGGIALVNTDATCEAVFTEAAAFRWVHFACHGRFQRQAPLMSHLRLAGEPLYAADVLQRLRLQADLVTLGACETGRNKVLKGDELIGLVRAFIYAGTPSVVVSLWPVDELSTRILMERFYQELLAGQPKAAALRTAQQYVRNLTATQVTTLLTSYGEPDPADQVQRLLALTHTPQSPTLASTASSPAARLFAHPYFWAPFVLIGDQMSNIANVPAQPNAR